MSRNEDTLVCHQQENYESCGYVIGHWYARVA